MQAKAACHHRRCRERYKGIECMVPACLEPVIGWEGMLCDITGVEARSLNRASHFGDRIGVREFFELFDSILGQLD